MNDRGVVERAIEFLKNIAIDCWQTFGDMSLYLLFGFLVAGFLSVFISPATVERHLGHGRLSSVIKAALFGVPLPLCSCGVIPVMASLRRHGASRAAVVSFLISTPQTGVDSIMVTYSMLGLAFAVFRPIAAFINGIIGGVMVILFGDKEDLSKSDQIKCEGPCCADSETRGKFVRALRYGFISLPEDIGKALLIGVVIAGVITALVPDDMFAGYLGKGLLPMFVMMAIGIPTYVCATASVPIAAALMMKGISPGAAFVFLMTGPATNAATIVTIWKVLGRKTAILYLVAVASTALISGMVLDYIFSVTAPAMSHGGHWMIPQYLKSAGAAALLAIIIIALVRKKLADRPRCKHCH